MLTALHYTVRQLIKFVLC